MNRWRSEPELQAALIRTLRAQGVALVPRFVCVAGEPDVVTADGGTIYELKYQLSRKAIFQAVGQVLLYRQCINPRAHAVVVGYPTPDTFALRPYMEALGIEVFIWDDDQDILPERAIVAADHQETIAPLYASSGVGDVYRAVPTLHWNIATLAQTHGLRNVPALAARMGVRRQAVYRLWRDMTTQVALKTVERLCLALGCACGDWFTFQVGSDGQPHLRWNIAAEARARGLVMTTLSLKTEVHLHLIARIWHGSAEAVAPSTLARIAHTLHAIQPFAIGDLLVWTDYHDPTT